MEGAGLVILDLFAGPGGWSEGLRLLGLEDVGIEWDAAACATRAAAGHRTIRADVAAYPMQPFMAGKVEGPIASPPCQDFSLAGKQAGRSGEKGQLIDVVPAWVAATSPRWIACEQVPPALPIWREHAETYRRLGYKVWTGVLNAADYGVPQTRRRALLLATLDGSPLPPTPTHAKDPRPGLFGVLHPWVTMAEALGWGLTDRPGYTFCGSNEGGPDLAGGSGARAQIESAKERGDWAAPRLMMDRRQNGAPVLDMSANPAPTVTGAMFGKHVAKVWWEERQATTIVGSFCPDIVAAPGYRTEVSRQDAEGSVRITIDEAGVLQSFRRDYPWKGSRSKQFEQVGNAVSPVLAAHVLSGLVGVPMEAAA